MVAACNAALRHGQLLLLLQEMKLETKDQAEQSTVREQSQHNQIGRSSSSSY